MQPLVFYAAFFGDSREGPRSKDVGIAAGFAAGRKYCFAVRAEI